VRREREGCSRGAGWHELSTPLRRSTRDSRSWSRCFLLLTGRDTERHDPARDRLIDHSAHTASPHTSIHPYPPSIPSFPSSFSMSSGTTAFGRSLPQEMQLARSQLLASTGQQALLEKPTQLWKINDEKVREGRHAMDDGGGRRGVALSCSVSPSLVACSLRLSPPLLSRPVRTATVKLCTG
jgi:hypothetical protein